MDRLTDKNKEMPTPISDHAAYYARCVNKLADYEDTGMEPKEIKRLIETNETHMRKHTEMWKDLEKYLKAEAEGHIVVLPCKVGDTVYVLVKEGKIEKYIVSGIIIDHNNTWIDIREIDNPYGGGLLNALQFGVDIFCTREDAEAALEGE